MRWGLLALAALLGLAAALRWFRIDAQSLWYDEGISAFQLTRSYADILPAAARDTHPPLYYWTLKAWGSAVGTSELGLRSLSAVWGVAAVGFTWLLGRRLFGLLVATLGGLLLAIAPLAVYYSQEVRMYAQVTALGLLAAVAYARLAVPSAPGAGPSPAAHALAPAPADEPSPARHALDPAPAACQAPASTPAGPPTGGAVAPAAGRPGHLGLRPGVSLVAYVVYVLAASATLYSQYLGAALLVAVNLHAGLWWRRHPARWWLAWLGVNALVGLTFVPWLPTFLDQQSHALNTSPRTPSGLLGQTLAAYGGGVAHGDLLVWAGAGLIAFGVAGASWAATAGLLGRTACPRRELEAVSLALLLWLLPLGLVLYLGLRSGLFELRYLVLSLPGVCLLAGLGAVRLTRWPPLAVSLGLLAGVPAAVALQQQYFDPSLARDDYRGLVAAIQAQAQPSDAILLSAPNQVEVFSYYYHGPLPVVGLPAQRPIDPEDTRRRLEALRANHQRVWLVQWAMNEADPQGVIATWLAANGFQASHAWYGTLQLALISFGAADAPTQQVDLPLSNGLRLEGYRLGSPTVRAGQTLTLALLWRGDETPTQARWKVFTHLLDSHDKVVAQRDAEPDDNLRPTTTWQPGEQVQDHYGIAVPPDLAPGLYTLEVGMYDGETRATFAGHGDHLVLGQVQVSP